MSKILILEDDETVRLPLIDLLEAENYTVVSAPDGKQGIEMAKKEKPDLIVSDIMMPEIDGHGVFEALQKDPITAVIPFIFLTAKTDPSDIREGLGLGADDYITKPFEQEDLLDSIQTRLNKYQLISEAALKADDNPEYDQIFIKDGESCWFVEYEKIRLLESEDNYVRVFFDKEKPLISRTLNYLEEKLPAKLFFRANRKQIINLRWIRNIQPWFNGGLLVTLKDDNKIQMSRRAAQSFKSIMGI
ncbi:response regulator transcription factor [Puniceicoccales bacterium CK1056]|uniref:Response regulator transcription factor n=1 Tax=Oceanipulchritudo coccoides TaxID=2706888 RepID=A0A6B2M602_9BACT|nr:response regulator [Oceanipulchritudo coccoides]NDV63534.1 response regulator transcription factor [Oceanipulchritudo coccoides]